MFEDPSLILGYWVPDAGGYLDAESKTVTLPAPRSERALTVVEHEGEKIAAVVHDLALAYQRRLIDVVIAKVGQGLTNGRLHAERAWLERIREDGG